MKRPHHPEIRALLRSRPDGMSVSDIAKELERIESPGTARRALECMPDAYIDRWIKTATSRGQYIAVWCVVTPPAHCPYPTDRATPETRWLDNTYARGRTLFDREQRGI